MVRFFDWIFFLDSRRSSAGDLSAISVVKRPVMSLNLKEISALKGQNTLH